MLIDSFNVITQLVWHKDKTNLIIMTNLIVKTKLNFRIKSTFKLKTKKDIYTIPLCFPIELDRFFFVFFFYLFLFLPLQSQKFLVFKKPLVTLQPLNLTIQDLMVIYYKQNHFTNLYF
jgi:hypothetical protein